MAQEVTVKIDQPDPPLSLWHALRRLAAAQRTIEKTTLDHPGVPAIERRLYRIFDFLLHRPTSAELEENAQAHPRCSVCQSAHLAEIEEMILAGESLRKTAARFPPLSHSSLYRHFQNHHLQHQPSDFDQEAWGYY